MSNKNAHLSKVLYEVYGDDLENKSIEELLKMNYSDLRVAGAIIKKLTDIAAKSITLPESPHENIVRLVGEKTTLEYSKLVEYELYVDSDDILTISRMIDLFEEVLDKTEGNVEIASMISKNLIPYHLHQGAYIVESIVRGYCVDRYNGYDGFHIQVVDDEDATGYALGFEKDNFDEDIAEDLAQFLKSLMSKELQTVTVRPGEEPSEHLH